jgi:hypothetical protein
MDSNDLRFQPDDAHGGPPFEPTAIRQEAIARRAYEISISPDGSTPESNWERAEAELRSQRGQFP